LPSWKRPFWYISRRIGLNAEDDWYRADSGSDVFTNAGNDDNDDDITSAHTAAAAAVDVGDGDDSDESDAVADARAAAIAAAAELHRYRSRATPPRKGYETLIPLRGGINHPGRCRM
jgi:hypothetical protein